MDFVFTLQKMEYTLLSYWTSPGLASGAPRREIDTCAGCELSESVDPI